MTEQEQKVLVDYLTAQQDFDNHLKTATVGYSAQKSSNLKSKIAELKKVFSAEEVQFLTSAAYLPELIAQFLK